MLDLLSTVSAPSGGGPPDEYDELTVVGLPIFQRGTVEVNVYLPDRFDGRDFLVTGDSNLTALAEKFLTAELVEPRNLWTRPQPLTTTLALNKSARRAPGHSADCAAVTAEQR